MRPLHYLACTLALLATLASPAQAQPILSEWPTIPVPPVPEAKAVTVQAATTALLMLDFQTQNCGRRPRCMASVPAAKELLAMARARGMPVVHAVVPTGAPADILADLAPLANEAWVRAGPNKFLGTELEAMLKQLRVDTLIVLGTAANGAVLHTAAHAALLGWKVVLPVDGVSGDNAYTEQYTIFHMANAPGLRVQTTLTTLRGIAMH